VTLLELNDIPMMIVQHHESDYLLRRAIDQFDRLYEEGMQRAKIILSLPKIASWLAEMQR